MRAVLLDGYIRISAVMGRSGESFISPDLQADKIRRYAELHGHKIAKLWTELDQSGATMNRPMFQVALERVEAGETAGIIVAKLDRFARTLTGALDAVKRIEAAGGQLISVEDHFDTSTPIGRFGFQVMLALAELEHGRIRDNWRAASARAVARGIHVSPRVPVGYIRRDDGRFELDPIAAPLIADAFRQRAQGIPSARIAETLNAEGVKTSYGGRWIGQTVQRMLTNRVYLGEARGQAGAVLEGAHQAIVDEDTFMAGVHSPDVAHQRAASLLAGLIRCAGCRYVMTRSGSKSAMRYRCRVDHTTGRCPSPTAVHPHIIENYVLDILFAQPLPVAHIVTGTADEYNAARQAVDRAETELETFRDAEGAIAALGMTVYLDGLQTRIDTLDAANHKYSLAVEQSQADGAISRIVSMRDEWDSLELHDQQDLLRSAIDCIMLRRGRIPISDRARILWRGQGPDDLPRRSKPKAIRSFTFD